MSRARFQQGAPFALVAFTALGTWLLSGVAIDEAVRFLAFELFFVLLPGCLLFVLLSPSPGGWLRVLAIGWPCGYAIEVGAFAVTSALHVRWLFMLLPLVAVLASMPFLIGARGRGRVEELRRGLRARLALSAGEDRQGEALAVAIALSGGLILLALMTFASYPLPAHAHSIFYYPDNVDDIAWAAEARHHWPITEPWVSGLASRYYIAVFIHFAAINQVTGVQLSTVVLRLFPTMATCVIALQLWHLGRSLGRSRWIAPTAVVLLLLVDDLNLDFTRPGAFAVETLNVVPLSPTYALGAIFFLGLLAVAQAWFTDTIPDADIGSDADADADAAVARGPWAGPLPRGSVGLLVLLGVLVLGGGASKTSAIADFIGGFGLLWLWRVVSRQGSRLLSCGLLVAGGCFTAVYLLLLKGGTASVLRLHPLDFMHYTVFGPTFTGSPTWPVAAGHSPLWLVALLIAAAGTMLCALVPLFGAGWLLRRPRAISPFTLLCFAVFAVSFVAYVSLSAPGDSEGYFFIYGYLALVPIAAKGLVGVVQAIPQRSRRKLALICTALLVVGIAAAESSRAVGGSHALWYAWYAVAYGLIACAVLLAVLGLQRDFAVSIKSRALRVFACCVPLLVTLGLVKPLTQIEPRVWSSLFHQRIALADSGDHQGMTAPLYNGLIWVRDHTTPCDVLAVNNHYTTAPTSNEASPTARLSHYSYYSAFTERRVLLESWYVTPRGERVSSPYPARLALNEQAVVQGSASALRELARAGVNYVLIDKTHGEGALEPRSLSRLEFENSALRVYRLLAAPTGAAGRCATVVGI